MDLQKFARPIIMLLGLVSCSGIMHASPALQGPASAATGISGLSINGSVYDVVFSNFASYNTVFGSAGDPTFLNDQTGAVGALDAIASFLNSESVTGITNLTGFGGAIYVDVPYGVDSLEVTKRSIFRTTSAPWALDPSVYTGFKDDVETFISYATFAASSAPEPAPIPGTLALVGIGLAGLGYQRHRHAKD